MIDRTGFLFSGAPCRGRGKVRHLSGKNRDAIKRSSRGALVADPETGEENTPCHLQCDRAGDIVLCCHLQQSEGFFVLLFLRPLVGKAGFFVCLFDFGKEFQEEPVPRTV